MAPTATETRTSADLLPDLLAAADKVAELRRLPDDKRGDTFVDDVRKATAELHALDAEHDVRSKAEARAIEQYAWDDAVANPAKPEARGPRAAFGDLDDGYRTIAETVTADERYTEWAAAHGGERMPEILVEGRSLLREYRTLLDSTNSNGPSGLIPAGQPRPPQPREMKFFLRDLLSVVPTTLAAIPYVRELNPATNETGASTVAESEAKPETVMEFEDDVAVVKKIAAWIPASMEILSDAPTLQGYVNARLAYMLQVREQAQVLNGAGTGADLKGILTYSGIQTVTTATNGDPFPDLAAAIGKVENVDLDANGIAMNATDYWTSIALRHSTQFDGGVNNGNAPFGGPLGTIWGLPVVRTRALTSLTAVVADWAMGATLFDREQTSIRQSDSHDDYFVKNKVAILAEERVALAVERPDAFVKVTIDITP